METYVIDDETGTPHEFKPSPRQWLGFTLARAAMRLALGTKPQHLNIQWKKRPDA